MPGHLARPRPCIGVRRPVPSGPMRVALSIAGSDPSGGAGLQADLQVFRHFGLHGAGVVSALTVQDSGRVHQVLPVFPSVVLDQIRVLLRDVTPHAVKIGALASDDVVRSVLLGLADLPADVPLVIDPVLRASDGSFLLERRAWPALCSMFSRATLVTPNLEEARDLCERDPFSPAGAEEAARTLVLDMGASAVLLKGGHREGRPDDLLAIREGAGETPGVELRWLEGTRVEGGPVHGTGCALASAIAAGLALGHDLANAVDQGRRFVAEAIRNAEAAGAGARFLVYR